VSWQIGQTVLNQYVVKQVFTSGGMGLVYQVRHSGWQIDIALKRPRLELFRSPETIAGFEAECETWARLGLHPHVATCYYSRSVEDVPCVFAEFVGGGSLRDWIVTRRLYQGGDEAAVARILSVAIEFAWGLDWAHQHGVIHQDVKPGNVLMIPDGTTKVTDFGLAGAVQEKVMLGTPQPGESVAYRGWTPAYGSPEQAQRLRVTRATDVWSWAVSVMEMFAGGVYWHSGPAAPAALDNYKEQGLRTREMPQMPKPLFRLLAQCLASDPKERPNSFTEIAHVLRKLYESIFDEECDSQRPDTDFIAADSMNNRAVSLLDVKRDDEAAELLKAALSFDPNHPEASYNMGMLLLRDGRASQEWLIKQLQECAAADPLNWIPLKLLATVLIDSGDPHRAMNALGRARQLVEHTTERKEMEDLLDEVAEASQTQAHRVARQWVLARPRCGAEHSGNARRFKRLLSKAEAALAGHSLPDAARYLQMAKEISGHSRHPQLTALLARVGP